MIKLNIANYPAAYSMYRNIKAFFPLIGAVLLDEQDGVVYVDKSEEPTQFYVEHKFGFAQIFGLSVLQFEADLQRYLTVDKNFVPPKIRLYTPHLPIFLQSAQWNTLRSQRQRFILDPNYDRTINDQSIPDIYIGTVDQGTVAAVDSLFNVVDRFWRSSDDFIRKARSVVAWINDKPAAICYAAAEAGRCAEIDVLTLPQYRHLKLGKQVVSLFNTRCLEQGIRPLWDCFTNNAGSMALCKSTGFIPYHSAYPFFTFNKLLSES